MNLAARIDRFFFARSSATGLGAMRIAWASVAFAYFLMQWRDISFFYSDAGLLPRAFLPLVTRDAWYVSLFTAVGDPSAVFALYLAMLLSLAFAIVGILPRLSTIIAFLLMCSFHERDALILGGGDTVLRSLGFILAISPGIGALSLSRLRRQYAHWKETRAFLKPVQSPAWSYRLILWQALVIYLTSLQWKLLGDAWMNGVAAEIALHHPTFSRWPAFTEHFLPLLPFVTYATLVFEFSWIILLLPRAWRPIPMKLSLLGAGVLFHLSILVFMDAGSFSLAMMGLYLGLLREEDIAWLRNALGKKAKRATSLYDGNCGLCLRSMFFLSLCDWFKKVSWKDFRLAAVQKKEAIGFKAIDLKREMHVVVGKDVTTGFYGFRTLARRLPPLWPLVPFLYVPGVPWIGRRIYARIASRRTICTHKECRL